MERSWRTLVGAAFLSGSLGTLHAFSVLIQPIEAVTAAPRAGVSLVYSTAIVCLTFAIFVSHRIFATFHPATVAVGLGLSAAAGLTVAASTDRLSFIVVGYGVLFGFANGIGYGLSLERAASGWPARKGLAIGLVTATYAGGAMAFAWLFPPLLTAGGLTLALAALAAGIVVSAAIGAALFARSPPFQGVPAEPSHQAGRVLWALWAGYLFGATAGLMTIGHAAGIVAAGGGTGAELALGAVTIAFGNGVGSLVAGWLTDRFATKPVLIGMAAASAMATAMASFAVSVPLTIAYLGLIGFAYGALIAVYPVAAASTRTFGRVFTAWGIAGLAGPWLAGALYDATGGYELALLFATAASLASAVASYQLPRDLAK